MVDLKRKSFSTRINSIEILLRNNTDILFSVFLVLYSLFLYSYVVITVAPVDDAVDYLSNARAWLHNLPLVSEYRPPLISLYISSVWMLTGENWLIIEYLQPIFTIGAGIILYITLRKYKGGLFAFGVSALTLLNPTLFFWSTQIMIENISLFLLLLSLYFIKSEKGSHGYLAGLSIALTFAARYSILIEAVVIFVVECIVRKDIKFASRTIVTAVPIIIAFILLAYLKVGYFAAAQDTDTHFTFLLSTFYVQNSVNIWGLSFVLLPVAFLFRRTYTDKYNYTFIAWFIVSLLFWSANSEPSLHSPRYLVQFTPAVYYLAILAIENLTKINTPIKSIFTITRRSSQ